MIRLLAIFACVLAAVSGQSKSPAGAPQKIEITLERMEGSVWRAIDPGLVLKGGDRVRFRCRTNFDGYLYVINRGTTGAYTLLFPREETGRQNSLSSGKEYLVPATEAWFKVAGPPGYDVVYWMVSPVTLEGGAGRPPGYVPLPPPPEPKAAPPNLLPRCDDAIFRARGLCIDSSAGPRSVPDRERLPENLARIPSATSRELIIMRKQNQATVSSPGLDGPLIYEFRLAHR